MATARELILLAQQGDSAGFGAAYGEVLDGPEPDAVTEELLALLTAVARDWFGVEADGATVLAVVHDRVTEAYPRTLEVLGVNLVILEHVVRAALGHSDFLQDLDGSLVCLYSAILLGSLLVTGEQVDGYQEQLRV